MKPGSNCEFLRPRAARDNKSPKFGWRSIIGMAFQSCAQLKYLQTRERPSQERVQAVQHAETHGDATAESARLRHIAADRAGERKRRPPCSDEKPASGFSGHSTGSWNSGAMDRDTIINPQRHSQAIKARPEIGSGGGDAHGDLLCVQGSHAPLRLESAHLVAALCERRKQGRRGLRGSESAATIERLNR